MAGPLATALHSSLESCLRIPWDVTSPASQEASGTLCRADGAISGVLAVPLRRPGLPGDAPPDPLTTDEESTCDERHWAEGCVCEHRVGPRNLSSQTIPVLARLAG